MSEILQIKDGLLTCARYAFMPNKLEYCGGDGNYLLFDYCRNFHTDKALEENIEKFETLYPYLKLIAHSNRIEDVFDPMVVEAYWIGNELLNNVTMANLYWHWVEAHKLKKKTGKKAFDCLVAKIPKGARPHHSFHVFNMPKRTGHFNVIHSIETMDKCRIGWGKIKKIDKKNNNFNKFESLTIIYKPLIFEDNILKLSNWKERKVYWKYDGSSFLKELNKGDWVSIHWDWVCEKLSLRQIKNLEIHTNYHIRLANLNLPFYGK